MSDSDPSECGGGLEVLLSRRPWSSFELTVLRTAGSRSSLTLSPRSPKQTIHVSDILLIVEIFDDSWK